MRGDSLWLPVGPPSGMGGTGQRASCCGSAPSARVLADVTEDFQPPTGKREKRALPRTPPPVGRQQNKENRCPEGSRKKGVWMGHKATPSPIPSPSAADRPPAAELCTPGHKRPGHASCTSFNTSPVKAGRGRSAPLPPTMLTHNWRALMGMGWLHVVLRGLSALEDRGGGRPAPACAHTSPFPPTFRLKA